MKPVSFRFRIALLSALISGVVLLAFGAMASRVMYLERRESLDRELRGLAFRHPGWLSNRANYARLGEVIEFVFGEERRERLLLLVKDGEGNTRHLSAHWPRELDPKSLDLRLEDKAGAFQPPGKSGQPPREADEETAFAPPGTAAVADPSRNLHFGRGKGMFGFGRGPVETMDISKTPRFETVRAGKTSWRLGIFGHEDDRLVIGLDTAEMRSELSRLRNTFLMAMPVALLVVGLGGWWIAGRAVRPLRSITETAEQMTARGLDHRIPPSGEDPEIARLIRVFNGMMDRLEKSFRQATRFSADASHELRTPLAIMQGELENALQAAAHGSREQQVLANLLEETQRLKAITQSLLLLAQADAGRLPLDLKPVNFAAELRELSEDAEALAGESGLALEWESPPEVWIRADWPLLRQAVLNLLINAVRYNEPDGRLGVKLVSLPDSVEMEVWNSGPGIPGEDQPRLFDRFFRAGATRNRWAGGAGLGLSLSREIVRAHGGALDLKESRTGYTCFRLSLPGSEFFSKDCGAGASKTTDAQWRSMV